MCQAVSIHRALSDHRSLRQSGRVPVLAYECKSWRQCCLPLLRMIAHCTTPFSVCQSVSYFAFASSSSLDPSVSSATTTASAAPHTPPHPPSLLRSAVTHRLTPLVFPLIRAVVSLLGLLSSFWRSLFTIFALSLTSILYSTICLSDSRSTSTLAHACLATPATSWCCVVHFVPYFDRLHWSLWSVARSLIAMKCWVTSHWLAVSALYRVHLCVRQYTSTSKQAKQLACLVSFLVVCRAFCLCSFACVPCLQSTVLLFGVSYKRSTFWTSGRTSALRPNRTLCVCMPLLSSPHTLGRCRHYFDDH